MGAEDSLCKKFLTKCFKTKNFDTFHQGMGLQHVFQIPLPNSEFRLCNRQCFSCMFRSLFRIYLALLMFYKEKCLLKDG